MKILCTGLERDKDNGGYYVANRNIQTLKHIVGDENVTVCNSPHPNLKTVAMSLICVSSYGMTRKEENHILRLAIEGKYDIVYVDITLFGSLVKRLHKAGIKTMVFAHNVETVFFKQRCIKRRSVIYAIQYYFARYCEKLTAKYASAIIALNKRDADDFYKLFRRNPDAIMPISCPNAPTTIKELKFNKPYCIFVGSNFFANVDGIEWFIKNVAPFISYDVRVVGSCCNNIKLQKLELPSNVVLEGYVDDLSAYYRAASFVIAPIFSGSGMKTKTIEALSYGKCIVGTNEAFVGVECDYSQVGGKCETAQQFIDCINNLRPSLNNPYSIKLFKDNFTDSEFERRLNQLIQEMI